MSQTKQLIQALKRQLKAQGITYARVAAHLQLSEASIKRLFSHQRMSLQTLESICDLLQITLSDLIHASSQYGHGLRQLTEAQETSLVASHVRVLIAVCVLNQWTFKQMVETYRIPEADCLHELLQLDKLGLIQLLPENRVKLLVSREFSWLPDGPIYRFFRDRVQSDFLNAAFNQPGEVFRFRHAMLSPAANTRFQQRLQRLVQEFAELHEESRGHPSDERFGTSLLLAMRSWEPSEFESLRHRPDSRAFPSTLGLAIPKN